MCVYTKACEDSIGGKFVWTLEKLDLPQKNEKK